MHTPHRSYDGRCVEMRGFSKYSSVFLPGKQELVASASLLLVCGLLLTHMGGGQRPGRVITWISFTFNEAQEGTPQLAS